MALIKCPECKKDVSDKAEVCPNCGYSIANHFSDIRKKQEEINAREEKEKAERERYNQRVENVEIPPKHRASLYFSSMLFGSMFLLMLSVGYNSSEQPQAMSEGAWLCVVLSVLFIIIIPVIIYIVENERYKKIQANTERYRKRMADSQIRKEKRQEAIARLTQPVPIKCRWCGSDNVTVSFQTISAKGRMQSEIKGNKIVSKENQKANQSKMAACQNCGHSWKVWY